MMSACDLVRSRIDHTRHGRPSHFLSRQGLSILIDLDRLPQAETQSAMFSVGRFNLLSFSPSDYGPNFRSSAPFMDLASYARSLAAELCPQSEIATVQLLTFPRILGVAFNPVSIYLLRDRAGADVMYIYEVRNTFGDMHSYVGMADEAGSTILQAEKIFHVSPFFPVKGEYWLRVKADEAPDGEVRVLMRYDIDGKPGLTATLRGRREMLNNRNVLRSIMATRQWPLRPLLSIHVEAARLWFKKVPFFRRPEPPRPWSRARRVSGRISRQVIK